MRALIYLGCTVPVRNLNYEASARKVAEKLGVELVDDDQLACCGFPLKSADQAAALAIAARNLAVAAKHDLPILPLCSACAGTLAEAAHHLDHHPEAREMVNRKLAPLGLAYEPGVKVKHFLRFLAEDYGLDNLKAKMTRSLAGYSFAPHYGCHYLKPSEVVAGSDDPENPESLARLIELTGASAHEYSRLKDCCGGGVLGADEDLANSMSGGKLAELSESEITALALACPFCNVMFEGQQKAIGKKLESKLKVPVVYVTQVLGLGLGISPDELGFKLNRVKPKEMLKALEG